MPQLIEKIGATRRIRTADLLITNRRKAVTGTKKTQAFPMTSARWASGRWVCLGLVGTRLQTQFGHTTGSIGLMT